MKACLCMGDAQPHMHRTVYLLFTRKNGEGNGNPLQYSYLENPVDRGA